MRKDVTIHAPTATAYFGTHARQMLFDPERPTVDADQLLKELGGMTDPRLVNHNCPVCHKTMRWELFVPHARPCLKRWFNTLDIVHRKFAGAEVPNE